MSDRLVRLQQFRDLQSTIRDSDSILVPQHIPSLHLSATQSVALLMYIV